MDADEIAYKRELLEEHLKRLRIIEKQAVGFGPHLPAYIQLDLNETRSKIAALRSELGDTEVSGGPLDYRPEVHELLTSIQARTEPLSASIARALPLVQRAKSVQLENFCRNELSGWRPADVTEIPKHRLVKGYVSPFQIDTSRPVSDIEDIFRAMARTEGFIECWFPLQESISRLESREASMPPNTIVMEKTVLGSVNPNAENADLPVYTYGRRQVFGEVLESIRTKLTRELLDLLN